MNYYTRSGGDAATTTADLATTDDRLARCKRRSLGSQALRAAWDLGALVRRVEREAPEAHGPLRDAVAALMLLRAQLAPEHAGLSRKTAGTGAVNETSPAGSARQGELF